MFDRYPGDNKTQLMPEQKLYTKEDGTIIVPAANIQSFLCAENTKSAVKMFYDPRKYKRVAQALLGFVLVDPFEIPLTRDGQEIKFEGWDENGITLHNSVARLEKGVPNPKERPLIDTPWELEFQVRLFPNDEISEVEVKNLFDKGGVAIGLGTYRGVFGKFAIDKWD